MGSLRKKGDGWEIRWYAAGRQRSKTFHGTRSEAKAQLQMWEAADQGKPRLRGPVTMEDVMVAWIVRGGKRRSPTTGEAVRSRVNNWIIPRLGHLPVDRIDHRAIEGFLNELARSGELGAGSIRNLRWDISGALRLAVRDGFIHENPAEKVSLDLEDDDREVEPPSVADIAKLLVHCDSRATMVASETALAIRLAIATGSREGEIAALQWGDFEPELPALRVERTAITVKGKTITKRTKTRVRRRVAIPEAFAERLVEIRAERPSTRPTDFILLSKRPGEPIRPATICSRFRAMLSELAMSFRFHDLRHFTSSAWIADLGLHAASRTIGHSRISTTADTYGHLIDGEVDRRAADAISRRIDL